MANMLQRQEQAVKNWRQKKRVVQCATNLVERISGFVDVDSITSSAYDKTTNSGGLGGADTGFITGISEEAQDLSSTPFGAALVTLIGRIMVECSKSEISTIDGVYYR